MATIANWAATPLTLVGLLFSISGIAKCVGHWTFLPASIFSMTFVRLRNCWDKDVATTMICTHVRTLAAKASSGIHCTHSEPRRFGFIRIRIKLSGRVRHSTLLITRDLTERSARFSTEENFRLQGFYRTRYTLLCRLFQQ